MLTLYDSCPFENFVLFPYALQVVGTHLVISMTTLCILIEYSTCPIVLLVN